MKIVASALPLPLDMPQDAQDVLVANRIFAAYSDFACLTLEASRGIVAIARAVGANPFLLANLVRFESGFCPWEKSSLGYSGILQFSDTNAASFGLTQSQIRSMSFMEQVPLAIRYLKKYAHFDLSKKNHLYWAVFYPSALDGTPGPEDLIDARARQSNPGISTPMDYVRMVDFRARLGEEGEIYANPDSRPKREHARPGGRAPGLSGRSVGGTTPRSKPERESGLGKTLVLIGGGAAAWWAWKKYRR